MFVHRRQSLLISVLIPYAVFKKLLYSGPPLHPSSTPLRVDCAKWGRDTLELSLTTLAPFEPLRDSCHYHSFGSRLSLAKSDFWSSRESTAIITFDLNPWAAKYYSSPQCVVDTGMPHLDRGGLESGWRAVFRTSEYEGSSPPYAFHHTSREGRPADADSTTIVTDPFGYTEVVRALSWVGRVSPIVISDT